MNWLGYLILTTVALVVFLCGCANRNSWTNDYGRVGNAWVALTEPR